MSRFLLFSFRPNKTFLVFIIVLIVSIQCSIGDEDSGWLQICSPEGDSYKIYAGGCPRGVWVQKPLAIGCVCVNGVWALTKGPCDDNPYLLVGKGKHDCFTINSEVDTFKYIGRPSDPFAPGDYISPNFLSVFWKLPTSKASSDVKELNGDVAMISINTENVVESRGKTCCRKVFPGNNKIVQVCMSEHGKYYKAQSWCSTGTPQQTFHFELDHGEGIQLMKSGPNGWEKSTFLRASSSCSKTCSKVKPKLKTDCCKNLNFEDFNEETALEIKRINDQTGRIATKLLRWNLYKEKTPKVQHPEYIYIKKAKGIIMKLCPKADLSPYLLNSMLHLFRLLLIETMENYPLVKHYEPQRHKRIIKSLNTCIEVINQVQPIELHWGSEETCPRKVDKFKYDINGTISEHHVDLPEPETFLSESFDYPLEAIWKIMSFTHYTCAKYFKKNPSDHSHLMVSLESFFNPELSKRWANPGKSFDVMKLIFNTYDLNKFATALDACVSGSRAGSEYKQWIIRPVLKRFGPNPGDKPLGSVWDGMGYCLKSYWDPEEQPGADLKIHPETHAHCYPSFNSFYQM